jgi:hypothetical protein
MSINQSLEAVIERNKQVALMREVYSRAKQVLVWLGDIDVLVPLSQRPNIEAALEWIIQFSEIGVGDDAAEEELVKLAGRGNVTSQTDFTQF